MDKEKRPLGFTNKMAVFILAVLASAVILSFILAVLSIKYEYMGALACWTACLTPIGIGLDIVLNSVVKKNHAENTGESGEGIRYRQLVNEMEGKTI